MHFRSSIDPSPCGYDPQILPHLIVQEQQAQENQQNCAYQLVAAGREDWQTVQTLYNASKVGGYEIAKIEVVVNDTFSQAFFSMLKIFEERSQQSAFKPTWKKESISDQEREVRQESFDHLMDLAKTPGPFQRVKVIPMFHGTKQGLLKHIFAGSLAALSTTDVGFFGTGIYHTSSACYAYKYAQHTSPASKLNEGALLMNWVCFSSAYPVIHHPDVKDDSHWETLRDPLKKRHWRYLVGRPGPIEGKYDAHYVLVAPKNEMDFFPCRKEKAIYNELVTFFPGQVLPRYLVTLTPDALHTATLPTPFTTSHMKIALQELTDQIGGPLGQALLYRLKRIGEERSLTQNELVELGHLLYLTQNAGEQSTSAQFLLEKIQLEQIRNQEEIRSQVFPFFFEEPSLITPLKRAEVDPFEAIDASIQQSNFISAVDQLLFVFSLDVEPALCYHYLYLLLPHIKDLDPLIRRLPPLFARSSSSNRIELALRLHDSYVERKAYPQAIYCMVKASAWQKKESFTKTTQLFTGFIFPFLQLRMSHIFEQTAEEFEKALQRLSRFFLNHEQFKPLLHSAKENLNTLPSHEQHKYMAFQEKILDVKPFNSQPVTEKYHCSFQLFLNHFGNKPETSNVLAFQKEGVGKLRSFFEVLLEDALLILGPPPCAYDIRAIGSVGREAILPSLEQEYVLLVEQKKPYFISLKKILHTQLLTLGKQTQWHIIDAKIDLLPSLVESVSLAHSSSMLYTHYREDCPKPIPQFHCPKHLTSEVSFSDLQTYYIEPLHRFLGGLALYHKIDKVNPLEIVEDLQVLTKETKLLLQENLAVLYQLALHLCQNKSLSLEQRCLLQRCEMLVLTPLSSHQSYKNLDLIGKVDGSFGQYHINKLHRLLGQWITSDKTGVRVTGAVSGYLDAAVKIFDKEGNIQDGYKNRDRKNAHTVSFFKELHFKQKPSHPLMEYAIFQLFCRCAGRLAPPTMLVRFDVMGKSYPVLISETIFGRHPTANEPSLDLKQWTQMLLCSILTRPGDGRFSNYIVDKHNKVYCVDNDVSFVEPVCSENPFSRTVQFNSALFFMKPLDTPLDKEALEEFLLLDRSSILTGWMEDLIQKEKEYLSLFSEREREFLYHDDEQLSFTPTILFKKGTIATLDLQFWKLQNLIQHKKQLTAGDLLLALTTLEETVGGYVHKRYLESKTLEQAMGRKDCAMTSIEYTKAALGKVPSHKEIEERQLYSPEKARGELYSAILMRCSKFAEVSFREGETHLAADCKYLEKKPSEEILFLKGLARQAAELKPSKVILNHSTQLTPALLAPFLHAELRHLDLCHCPHINDEAVTFIHAQCPRLEKLLLSGTGITAFRGNVFSRILEFPCLKELQLDRCPRLHTIQIRALKLQVGTAKYNPKLNLCEIKSSPLFRIDCAGSPQVKPSYLPVKCIQTLEWDTMGSDTHIQLKDDTLAIGCLDGTVKLWDPLSGTLKRTLMKHKDPVIFLRQLSDDTLVSGSADTIKLWDPLSGTLKHTLEWHTNWVIFFMQLEDGTLVTKTTDNTIVLWDLVSGVCKNTLKGMTSPLIQLKDGGLVSKTHENELQHWDPSGNFLGTLVWPWWMGPDAIIVKLADGTLACGKTYDSSIYLGDLASLGCKELKDPAQKRYGYGYFRGKFTEDGSWSPDSDSSHSAEDDDTLIFDNSIIKPSPVQSIIEFADGTLASISKDETIKIWDPISATLKCTLKGVTNWENAFIQLKDGTLAGATSNGTINLWDPLSGVLKQTLVGQGAFVCRLVQLADGTLASGTANGTIDLWDPVSGNLKQTLKGHTRAVIYLFQFENGTFASRAADGSIKLWQ